MPKINRYVDIDTVEREARKDYIDRHSPFIHCADSATAGEVIAVTIKMGNEYTHPDDFDHYISSVSLFNGETLLAKAEFMAGMLGGTGAKGHSGATFNVLATGKKMTFVAHSYCTKHGVWESDPKVVTISE